MNIRKFAATAALAVAGMLAGLSAASAYDAAATTAVNVRSGPGTGYSVVGVLNPGQIVNVIECNASNTWCRIQDRTVRGWASAAYLRDVSGTPVRPGPGAQPDVGFSIQTPNFSFQIGTPGSRPGVVPPRGGQVCFFEDYDYRGRSFCARDGESARSLGRAWDDRIRSVRVEGNVEATVCTSNNLRGLCSTIDRSVRNLGRLSDDISSYEIARR